MRNAENINFLWNVGSHFVYIYPKIDSPQGRETIDFFYINIYVLYVEDVLAQAERLYHYQLLEYY